MHICVALHKCFINVYIYLYINSIDSKLTVTSPHNSSLMLQKSQPQILSHPLYSINAFEYPLDFTSKFTILFPSDCFTKRKNCVWLDGRCGVCNFPLRVFEFLRNIIFHYPSLFYRQSEMNTLIPFKNPQTLDGDFCCHTTCGS